MCAENILHGCYWLAFMCSGSPLGYKVKLPGLVFVIIMHMSLSWFSKLKHQSIITNCIIRPIIVSYIKRCSVKMFAFFIKMNQRPNRMRHICCFVFEISVFIAKRFNHATMSAHQLFQVNHEHLATKTTPESSWWLISSYLVGQETKSYNSVKQVSLSWSGVYAQKHKASTLQNF